MSPLPLTREVLDLAGGTALFVAGWALFRRGVQTCAAAFAVAGALWFAGSFSPGLALAHRVPLVAALVWLGPFRSARQWWVVLGTTTAVAAVSTHWQRGILGLVLGGVLVALAADRRSWAPSDRTLRDACITFGSVMVVVSASRWIGVYSGPVTSIAYSTGVICSGLLAARAPQPAAERLAVDLALLPHNGSLVERLRFALGDPQLDLVESAELAAASPLRSTTVLTRSGRQVGVLSHAADLRLDPAVIEGVAAIVGLAVEASDLRAVAAETLADIERSSRLLAGARDREAVELARQVEHGPIAHLIRAMELVDDGPVCGQLGEAIGELRQVTEGLELAGIEASGLSAALQQRASASPLPVDLQIDAADLPLPVARAVFLVCCEAQANSIKHAAARRIRVCVKTSNSELTAEVADDGCGGADASGSGLRGVADRVHALGGCLTVDSPPGRGTKVRITVPVTWGRA